MIQIRFKWTLKLQLKKLLYGGQNEYFLVRPLPNSTSGSLKYHLLSISLVMIFACKRHQLLILLAWLQFTALEQRQCGPA